MSKGLEFILTYTCLMVLWEINKFAFLLAFITMVVMLISDLIQSRREYKEIEKEFDKFMSFMDNMCEDCDDENCERNKKDGKEKSSNETN